VLRLADFPHRALDEFSWLNMTGLAVLGKIPAPRRPTPFFLAVWGCRSLREVKLHHVAEVVSDRGCGRLFFGCRARRPPLRSEEAFLLANQRRLFPPPTGGGGPLYLRPVNGRRSLVRSRRKPSATVGALTRLYSRSRRKGPFSEIDGSPFSFPGRPVSLFPRSRVSPVSSEVQETSRRVAWLFLSRP